LFSNIAIQTGLILRTAFGLALRQTEGLLGSIICQLGSFDNKQKMDGKHG
jgi:hypothetical protein